LAERKRLTMRIALTNSARSRAAASAGLRHFRLGQASASKSGSAACDVAVRSLFGHHDGPTVGRSPATTTTSTSSYRAFPYQPPRSFSTAAAAPAIQEPMFCRQCEQTNEHHACLTQGVCGKTAETSATQDALLSMAKSVSASCVQARAEGVPEQDLMEANVWTLSATFSTLTNVNFSEQRIVDYLREGQEIKDKLNAKLKAVPDLAKLDLTHLSDLEIEDYGHSVSVPKMAAAMNHEDAFCLNELAQYALKGVCAYAMHCHQLGSMDKDVMKSIHEIYVKIADPTPDVSGLLETVLRVGAVNAQVLAMLDGAHADSFGAPVPSPVRTTAVKGKCILVSGHDMQDLFELLKQTEGTGVNVYTHGEMLPAHAYPKLQEFKHLVGNYGTAWQNQTFEFAAFPGPIIMTTNCIMPPRRLYKDRLYTINEVGFDGVQHIEGRNFAPVIEQAQHLKGFPKTWEPAKFVTTGFNHRSVLPLADKILGAVKDGALSRIFLIGGCDGSQISRSYFTDLAEETPPDSIILTLGCAKNRLIHSPKLDGAMLGDSGIPRVLDMGQCNDSYSAVVVALELAKALNCTVNDLPLSLAVSHLEQKAAAVLCTLLHLGVKNIRLGPSLPAYITPNVLAILQKEYNLMGTGDANEDLAAMMQGK
jgi:hydroxylamine reductase